MLFLCLVSVISPSEIIRTKELNANQREILVTATCQPQRHTEVVSTAFTMVAGVGGISPGVLHV